MNKEKVNKYLSVFVAILLVIVAVGSLQGVLQNQLAIFEGVMIALLSVAIILILTMYYRMDSLVRGK